MRGWTNQFLPGSFYCNLLSGVSKAANQQAYKHQRIFPFFLKNNCKNHFDTSTQCLDSVTQKTAYYCSVMNNYCLLKKYFQQRLNK